MARKMRFYLDIGLFVFLTTLFKRHVISADYHVWGGLVFFAFTLGHLWLNRQWLAGLWQRQKHWRDWTTVLLLVVWLALVITGVLAAKQFGLELHFLKSWHKFLGALSLLLVAMHIGFHWQYLKENILRCCPCLNKAPKALTAVLMAAALCLGAYGFVDSGFGKWISAPFVTSFRPKPSQDGSNRKKHQPRPFDPLRLGTAMAELSAMLYLGAYVVRKKK